MLELEQIARINGKKYSMEIANTFHAYENGVNNAVKDNIKTLMGLSYSCTDLITNGVVDEDSLVKLTLRSNFGLIQFIEKYRPTGNQDVSLIDSLLGRARGITKLLYGRSSDLSAFGHDYRTFMALGRENEDRFLHFSYSAYAIAAEIAKIRLRRAIDSKESLQLLELWAENWYDAQKSSTKVSRNNNPRQSAVSSVYAGKAAERMYRYSRDPHKKISWLRSAMGHYAYFLDYSNREPAGMMAKEVEEIKMQIERLRSASIFGKHQINIRISRRKQRRSGRKQRRGF